MSCAAAARCRLGSHRGEVQEQRAPDAEQRHPRRPVSFAALFASALAIGLAMYKHRCARRSVGQA